MPIPADPELPEEEEEFYDPNEFGEGDFDEEKDEEDYHSPSGP